MHSESRFKKRDKIIIIDFGSQVTKLIARRVRDLKVYCEIINLKELKKIENYDGIKGIILSGGPSTVTQKTYPKISKSIFEKNIPILGICYGLQLIAKIFGGKIKKFQKKREFGEAVLFEKSKSIIIILSLFFKLLSECIYFFSSELSLFCKSDVC